MAYAAIASLAYGSRTNSTVTAAGLGTIANGDILVALVACGASGTAPTVTPPAGFTAVDATRSSVVDGGFNLTFQVFIKVASSESGNYTFTHTAASTNVVIARYTGRDTTTPVNAYSKRVDTSSGNTRTADSITTTVNGCDLLYTGFDWASTVTNETPPSGMTERYDATLCYLADENQTTAGATGSRTNASNSNSAEPRGAWFIALAPTGGGGGISGTASITEAADTASSTGALAIAGAASITEAADTVSATGKVALSGTSSITEGGDTVSATGALSIAGQASITEAADTLSAAGESQITGSGSADITEADDGVSATGTLAIKATASVTEASDTVSASGVVALTGAANITEGADTVSAAGKLAIVGSAAISEGEDTVAAEGVSPPSEPILGEAGITEDDDTVVAFGARPNDRQPGGWAPTILVDRQGRPVNLQKKKNEVLQKARAVVKELPAEGKQEAKEAIRDLAAEVTAQHVRELQDALAGADKILDRVMAELARLAEEAEDEDDIEFLLLAS